MTTWVKRPRGNGIPNAQRHLRPVVLGCGHTVEYAKGEIIHPVERDWFSGAAEQQILWCRWCFDGEDVRTGWKKIDPAKSREAAAAQLREKREKK